MDDFDSMSDVELDAAFRHTQHDYDSMSDEELDAAFNGAPEDEGAGEDGGIDDEEVLRRTGRDGKANRLPDGEHNQWGGNLRNESRRMLLRRDANGKVNGYSTTSSMIVRHDDGKFAVIPTVVGGKELSADEAMRHYARSGEYWGMADDEESARKMAQDVHDTHAKLYQTEWNDYIHGHWDEVSDEIKRDRGVAYEHKKRTAPDKITLMERLANDDTDDERKKKEQAHHWQEDYSTPSMSPFGMGVARPKTARKYDDKAQMDDLSEIATEAGLADWQVKRIRSESKTPDEMREVLAYVAGNRPVRDGETPEQQTVGWRSVPKTIVNTAGKMVSGSVNMAGTIAGGVDEEARHAVWVDDPMAKKEGESFERWLKRVPLGEEARGVLSHGRPDKRNRLRSALEMYYKWEAPIAGKEGMRQEHSVAAQNGREGTTVGNMLVGGAKDMNKWLDTYTPVGNSGNAVVDWLEGAASGITQFAYLGPTMIAMSAADSYQQSRSMALESGRTGDASEALATGNALFDGVTTAAFYYAPFRRWMNGKGIVPVQPVEKFTFSGLSKAMGRFNAKREFLNQGVAALEAGGIMGIQGAGDAAFRQLASGEDLDLGEITIEGAKSGLDGIAIGAIMGAGRVLNARIKGAREYERIVREAAKTPQGRVMLARLNPDGMMELKNALQKVVDFTKANEKPAADFETDTTGVSRRGRAPAPDWKPAKETVRRFRELCDKAGLPADLKLAADILYDPNVAKFLGDTLNARFRDAAAATPEHAAIGERPAPRPGWRETVPPSQALSKKIRDEFGVKPAGFNIPQTADGKPALTPMKWRDNKTGVENTSRLAHDSATGVTIMEEADGTFSVYNNTGDSDGASTIAEAVEKAKELALMGQYTELERQRKKTVVENERAAKYGKKNVVYFNTMAEAAQSFENAIAREGSFLGTANAAQLRDPAVQDRDAFYTPDGTTVVILDNVHEVGDISRILAHEFVGHGGPNADFGGKVGARVKFAENIRAKQFDEFKKQIVDGNLDYVRASSMDAVNRDLGEVFAHYASANLEQKPSMLDKLVSKVNDAARKAGMRKTYSASDVKTMLARWREAVKGTGGDTIDLANASPRFEFFPAEAPESPVEAPGARGETKTGVETVNPPEAPAGDSGASGAMPVEPRRMTSAAEVISSAKTPFSAAEKAALEGASDVSGIDATDEMPAHRDFLSILSKDAPVVRLNPAKVDRSDAVLPNMKKDANRTSGITKPLSGEWHPTMGGIGAAWLTKDGKLVVITGRHRSELAERKGKSMLYYLYREADGFTKDDALIYDAVANIHDEKGTINDYLGFLDRIAPTREQAEKAGILSGKGLVAWSLYKDAAEAVRSRTAMDGNPGEGQISPQQATVIAEAAPRDADKRNPGIQRQLLKAALGGMRGKAFEMYARIRAQELLKTSVNENLLAGEQLELFTSPEDLAADILAQRQAQYRTKKAQGYGEVARNLRAALNGEGKLELNDEYAKELGVADKTDRKQLETAYAKAVERAGYWENAVSLDDADKAAMDAEINAAADAKAKKLAELKAKREAAKSGKAETKTPAPKTKTGDLGTPKAESGTKNADLETKAPKTGTPAPKTETPSPVATAPSVAESPNDTEQAQTAPTSVPPKTEATTPPKGEDAPQGGKTAAKSLIWDSVTPERSRFLSGAITDPAHIKAIHELDREHDILEVVDPPNVNNYGTMYVDVIERKGGRIVASRYYVDSIYKGDAYHRVARGLLGGELSETKLQDWHFDTLRGRRDEWLRNEAQDATAPAKPAEGATTPPKSGKPPAVKEPAEKAQARADAISSKLGIPITVVGKGGKVVADSTAAAKAAVSGKQESGQAAPKPRTPSIRMKDAAAEKKAKAALDAIDFDTPELSVPSDYQVVGLSPAPTRKVDDLVEWAERNGIIGRMTPEETNGKGEIDISKNSVREMLNPAQVKKSASPDAHFAVVTKLRDVIRVSHIEEIHPDYKKGADGKRNPANGTNPGVTINVAYAAIDYGGKPMRAKITLKSFSDKNTPTRAYAYHVAQIEVLTGNLANSEDGTGPKANTSIRRDIILNGVLNVNGQPLLRAKQTALSGGTSRNQNPSGNEYGKKWKIFRPGTRNVDIGAGRFDKATQFLAELGVENLPFDPVNRTRQENEAAAQAVRENPADTATVHNVLNVIDNDAVMDGIINQAARAIKKSGKAIFTIYEGNRSGKPTPTRDGYQRNAKTAEYLPHVKKYFGQAEAHGNIILASEPKDAGPAFWSYDSAFEDGISFDTPDFDPEKFGRLVTGVGKLVDVLVESGHKDFKALATYIYEQDAAKYERAKPVLQDIWNAVARARKLARISDSQADEIFGIIETQAKEAANGSGDNGTDGGVRPAAGRGEQPGGVLADGHVRKPGADRRVDGERPGAVPGLGGRLAEGEAPERREDAGGEAAGGTVSVRDTAGSALGESRDGADSGGNGHTPGISRVEKAAKKAADSTKPNPPRRDFTMTKAVEEAILEKKTANRVRNNLAAIKLIRELKSRDYAATPEEQETLAKFVGWGGLREAVFKWELEHAYNLERAGEPERANNLLRREGIGQSAYELHKELRQVLNDSEYESAKESASTAFYTPVEFVRVLHEALRRLGVKGGRFLGPSAGTGNFASAAGAYEKPVNWQLVEKDAMTGEMLKALFPNQRVTIGGFEDTKFPDGFFDFAIDNVPYADVPINDRSLSSRMFKIHDYFFAKTLAKLRPGGVMAFLTSTGTLDKTSPILRQFLTEHGGKIVGAVRLPNGFFSENAGTDVASDLVIVQKVEGKPDNSAFERAEEYGKTTEWVRRKGQVEKPLTYNAYFKDHPGQVVGKMEVANGQFGPTLKYSMPENADEMLMSISGAIDRAFDGIDKDLLLKEAAVARQQDHTPIYDDEGLRQGNVTMKDGKPFIKSGDMLEPIEFPKDRGMKKELAKRMRTPKQIMDGLMDLRKAMREVIDAQMGETDGVEADLAPLQAKLNETYDAFVKKNGSLHDKWISPFVMLDKADGNRLLALERIVKDESGKPKIVKSDIFTKRVISRGQRATSAETPKDALVISYSETGGINIPRIATLLDTTAEEAIDRLKEGGDAFENPQTGRLEPSWEYLSGRVRAKLAAARAAVEAGEEGFRANVEALEKVQPPMVRLEDTEIKFGATWVDPECMKDFLRDAFGSEHLRVSLAKNEVTGQWNIDFGRVINEDPWGETSWASVEFLDRVLNHGSMNHYETDPVDKKRYLDERQTEANKLAAEKLHSAFSQFIQSSEKWATPMYERYNAVMTDMVEIKLPENILPFRSAGMSEATLAKLFEGGDPKTPKKGREYQSAVIARGVLGNGSLCLAHCVGAGKTLEMQAIGVLGRHLGLFKKPMYVVPNHMLEQFTNEFVEAFPNANILKMSEDDVKPANRRAFFAQVANGNWDAIVVKHSTFSMKLPISDKYQKEFLEARIKDLDETIAAMREAGEKISVDQATKKKQKLQAKLEKLMNAENHDSQIVPFEELGVDQLFVDEAHNFKGMEITTRQGRTGGLNQGTSERATDLQMKTQYVQSLHGGDRGVVFATGTPLSNAPVVEAFVMLKYLAPNKLEEQGLKHFDDFVDAFGRITTESEFDVGGKNVKEKDKVSAFVNIPEMMKLFKSVVDIVNADRLDIPRPKPKYHMIDVEMSPLQEKIMETVAREASTPPSRKDRGKYLALTRIAKNACVSPRLLGFEDGGNKIVRAVSEIKKVYDETAANRGAQLVFTDIFNESPKTREAIDAYLTSGEEGGVDPELAALFGSRRADGKFNLNEEMRDLLVQAGIPRDEIAIIQDIDKSKGDKDANKGALFAKVRSGEVRVLIGSRPKMGEGTNVQERLAAIHLLHPGWKPAEDEQAIGRIIRYGNTYKEGRIFYYLTKGNANIGSYETKNHQLIGVKSKLIDQVMHGDETVRTVEMDESAIDRDMLMGLASGNKALMELVDVKKRVRKLELNTESTATSARRNKDKAEANSRILERRREEFAKEQEGAKEWREKNEGKPFALSTPDGRTIEKVKDMAEYVAGEMAKLLTQDRYDRDERTVLGDFNGVEMVLTFGKWSGENFQKFHVAVPLLGVRREINYSGFIPDFSQAAMTAFKGKILEAVSPEYAKAYENMLADMDRQAKKMSADADKLQKDYETMRGELVKLRTRQAELERTVTPLVVQALEDRSVAAYGNWAIAKAKDGAGYTAVREKDGKALNAPTVKELIPLMDAEDFASPKMAATKTADLRPRPDAKGQMPRIDKLAAGEIDFDTPELGAVNIADFDKANGTEIVDIVELSDALSSNDVATIAKYSRRYPTLAKTSDFLKSVGIIGEKFTIGSNAIKRHHGKDGFHVITPAEWMGISTSLSTGKPLGVARYYDPQKHRIVPNAYRIWTRAFIGGRPALVGVEVKSSGRDVFVNSVDTVFALDGAAIREETLIYPNSVEELRSVLADQSRQRYTEAPQSANIVSQSSAEVNGIDFDTPNLSPAEEAYAASEDMTPTEEVMRNVFGMTNDEIATALKAAGMEGPKHVKKPDATAWQQAEALLSNPSYMAKLSRAVAKFPRNIADYENDALNVLFRQRQDAVNKAQGVVDGLKETLDAFDAMPKAERDAEWDEERRKTVQEQDKAKAKLAQTKALMYETGLALTRSSSEAGRRLRSNRGLIDQTDYSYAGISGQIAAIAGGIDKITPEMDAKIREIAGDFASLDETGRDLATARLKAHAEKIVAQIKNGDKIRKAAERMPGDEAKRVMRNYHDAIAQIEVGAAEVGGTLIGLSDQQYPAWGKWLRAIGEYHCFENPDITEEECIKAIVEDISPFMDGVDANQVRDALTGFGHNFRQSRFDSQRLMNDLRSQARLKRQLDWMDETNTMPPLTGLVRDEPSDTTRNLQKQVQERKKEIPDAGRDERRLKSALEAAKKRVKNRIADLERAIATGEKIPGRERTVPEDIELREMKKRKDELQKEYDEIFKTERGLTDAERLKLAERTLGKMLEHALEDLDRARSGDFSKRPERPGVQSPTLDVLRGRLAEIRGQIRELKLAKYDFGMTPEELAAYNARKMANREKAIARLAERIANGDIRPQKKPQPPMPGDMQKRYDKLAEELNRGHRKLADLRREAANVRKPKFIRFMGDAYRFVDGVWKMATASLDFTQVGNQTGAMLMAHPEIVAKTFAKTLPAFKSAANAEAIELDLLSDPSVKEAVDNGWLHWKKISDSSNRGSRVELFDAIDKPFTIAGKAIRFTDIPYYGKAIANSDRLYATYINAASASLYSTIANDPKLFPGGATVFQKKMLCDMINVMNGSGTLSKDNRRILGKVFWAPGLVDSQLKRLVGYQFWHPWTASSEEDGSGTFAERLKMSKIGLGEFVRSNLGAILLGSLLMALFSTDDQKDEFAHAGAAKKLQTLVAPRIRHTQLDFTGGSVAFLRLGNRLVSGAYETATGKQAKVRDMFSEVAHFAKGRLTPLVSNLFSALSGKDYTGQDYGAAELLLSFAPISLRDAAKSIYENGIEDRAWGTAFLGAGLTMFGIGKGTYRKDDYTVLSNRFLESKKEFDAIENDELLDDGKRRLLLDSIITGNPLMRDDAREDIAADIAQIRKDEARVKRDEKEGYEPDAMLLSEIEREKAAVLEKIRRLRRR